MVVPAWILLRTGHATIDRLWMTCSANIILTGGLMIARFASGAGIRPTDSGLSPVADLCVKLVRGVTSAGPSSHYTSAVLPRVTVETPFQLVD